MASKSITVNGINIECFDDGSIFLPKSGTNKAHRTFGANHGTNRSKGGYLCVKLNGRNYKVHRLICQAFNSNPNGYPEVDHINGNRKDNRPENLRWCSRSENCKNTSRFDKVTKDIGIHKCDNKEEYNLRRSRLYESNHIRIDIINDNGKNSRIICTQNEYDILKPLSKKERSIKIKELRNGN